MTKGEKSSLNNTVASIEQPFFENKSFNKRVFLALIKTMLPQFYRAYNIPNHNERGEFIRMFYLYMRKIDDIVDGDYADETERKMYGNDKANTDAFMERQKQNILDDSMGGAILSISFLPVVMN